MGEEPDRVRDGHRWRDVAVVLLSLFVGFGAAVGLGFGRGDDGPSPAAPPRPVLSAAPTPAAARAPDPVPGDPVPTAAATPRDAVEDFLAAEANGDVAASWALLSDADREEVGSLTNWTTAHFDMYQITGHRVEEVVDADDRAVVRTITDFSPTLDPILGLVPAQAVVRWSAVPEGGGWRVVYAGTEVRPIYPPEELIPAFVAEWIDERRRCTDLPPRLLGPLSVAERLCGTAGEVGVGSPARIDRHPDAGSYLAAHGPRATEWARVVPVTAPSALEVIVAPVGDRWEVIGVWPSSDAAARPATDGGRS